MVHLKPIRTHSVLTVLTCDWKMSYGLGLRSAVPDVRMVDILPIQFRFSSIQLLSLKFRDEFDPVHMHFCGYTFATLSSMFALPSLRSDCFILVKVLGWLFSTVSHTYRDCHYLLADARIWRCREWRTDSLFFFFFFIFTVSGVFILLTPSIQLRFAVH